MIRSIGRGGMGEVYEAVEEPLGRRVAIKTLRCKAPSSTLLARFDRERRTLARLHHTNIVPIYATGSEEDLLYFAMPYLSGASLSQVIKVACSHKFSSNGLASSSFEEFVHEARSKSQSPSHQAEAPESSASNPLARPPSPAPIPHRISKAYIRNAVQVMVSVVDGLHHAHEAGFIHRDLKPGNIIVEEDGHAWVLRLWLGRRAEDAGDAPIEPLELRSPCQPQKTTPS